MDVVSGLTGQQKRPVEMSSGVPWSSLPLRKSGKLTKLRLVMIAAGGFQLNTIYVLLYKQFPRPLEGNQNFISQSSSLWPFAKRLEKQSNHTKVSPTGVDKSCHNYYPIWKLQFFARFLQLLLKGNQFLNV